VSKTNRKHSLNLLSEEAFQWTETPSHIWSSASVLQAKSYTEQPQG